MKTIQSVAYGVAIFAISTQLASAQSSLPNTVYNPLPSRIVGQPVLQQTTLTAVAPNNIEGREFNQPIGVAVDTSAAPNILYVADLGNNRVLAWKNIAAFTKGDPADKVIGQRDFNSSAPQGPGRDLTQGFTIPTAIAVDKRGSLYVVDGFNNRILRYPSPILQTGDLLTADLVIGQTDFSGRTANQNLAAPTEKTLFFSSGGSPVLSGLAFDAQGNLWVSDAGNNRVLRYPAASLGASASNAPSADLVLGQFDFVSNTIPVNTTTPQPQLKNTLFQPAGIAIDPKGRVFVADAYNRVVVYAPPFANGQQIARVMGYILPTKTVPVPPKISESTLGAIDSTNHFVPPNGVFFVGSNPYVVDTPNARILGYDPFESWPDEATAFSPPAKVVIGQPSFQGFQSNRGLPQPTNASFAGPQLTGGIPAVSGPIAGVFVGTDMIVADTYNHRVMVFPQRSGGGFDTATRLLGQVDFQYNAFNFIEGKEMAFNASLNACGGIFSTSGSVVIDPSSNPPHMYISDPANNRVLAYLDYRKVNAGSRADVVIGQPDFFTSVVNYPTNNQNSTNAQGLFSPEGLAVDADGNLFVADGCNGRVLRFPKPLDTPGSGNLPSADLVLGQAGFNGQPLHDLSRQTMRSTYGVAFTFDGHLVVSDPLANRILFFRKPAGGFQSGANADNVFGQPNFQTGSAGTLNTPRLMSLDPDDHLYVADSVNNRIAIFPNVPFAGDNPTLLFSITGLNAPYGVVVNKTTRDIWIANLGANQVLRFPNYENVVLNPSLTTANFTSLAPAAIGLDPFGNPVVAEALLNRVAFYFPAIDYTNAAGGVAGRYSGNAASLLQRFAPGMYAAIFPFQNSKFGDQTALNGSVPIVKTLGDIQVSVGGILAPLVYTSSGQINLLVPNNVPLGFQEFQVIRASTGQLIASWNFKIDAVSPGLFTLDGSGTGQVIAVNQDGTLNGPAHPAKAGTVVTLYGTGQGPVSTPQQDGVPATGIVTATGQTRVVINIGFVSDDSIQYSGLSPNSVGLWQINVKIPSNVPVGDAPIAVQMNGISSTSDPVGGLVRRLTIRTTP